MKHILLLGDSIRQSYQEYVRRQLEGLADVRYPRDNGRFGYYTLRYVYEWIKALSYEDEITFDIVHFNCGLWDVLRLSDDEGPFTGEKEYGNVLFRIYKRIRKYCPNAKIIFALTTKIIEPGFAPGIEVGYRRNDDIQKYNEIAKKIFSETDVAIDDLWSISESIIEMPGIYSDDVHLSTKLGMEALGDAVVSCLRQYLQ